MIIPILENTYITSIYVNFNINFMYLIYKLIFHFLDGIEISA